MSPVVLPRVQTGAVSCLVTDIYSDGASEIFSKFCLFPGTWTTFFFSECHFPQEEHYFAKLYYIAHFEGHVKAQGWLCSGYC